MSRIFAIGVLFAFGALHAPPATAQSTYHFNASNSSIEVNVYKEGVFSAFGHNHIIRANDVSGTVQFDPNHVDNSSVALQVRAASLAVVDPDASASDRQQVQATMLGPQVLDTARYPEISFRSTHVTDVKQQGGGWRVTLIGTLQIHGTQRPVSFPLTVSVTGGELLAEGDASVLQSDFGVTPIKVAGGAVKVKDRVRIHFNIHARP